MAGGKGKSSSGGRDHPVRAEPPQHGTSKTSYQEKAQVTQDNENQSGIASTIETVSLVLIAAVAFAIRLFSIVKYESVIHEFDPYFNYRVTQLASEKGESVCLSVRKQAQGFFLDLPSSSIGA